MHGLQLGNTVGGPVRHAERPSHTQRIGPVENGRNVADREPGIIAVQQDEVDGVNGERLGTSQ